jgi:hypothetical protein
MKNRQVSWDDRSLSFQFFSRQEKALVSPTSQEQASKSHFEGQESESLSERWEIRWED